MTSARTVASELVRHVAEQDRRIRALAASPQLATSSIEDGALEEYDADGQIASIIGQQFDGTHTIATVTGPPPPTPVAPTAEAVPGVVTVRWSGKFEDDAVSPQDFKHVSVHLLALGEYADPSNQRATIRGELGDTATLSCESGTYTVALMAWSLSGKHSEASETVEVDVPDLVDTDAITARLDDADEAIEGVRDELATTAANLSGRLSTAEGDLAASTDRLTTAEGRVEEAFGAIATVDADAQAKADAARDAAIAAAALDATAKAEAAESAAATEALRLAKAEAKREADEAEAAAKAYADAQASGEGGAALEAAKRYAEEQAEEARVAAEAAASLDATAKAEAAQAAAATEAARVAKEKADAALTAAKSDATTKADAAREAAKVSAAADATAKAEAAQAEAARLAAIDAKAKADKALADAKTASAADATAKADAAREAAKSAAALDATAKAEAAQAEAARLAAIDAKAKADAALAAAKTDASTKADKALADAKTDATSKADAAREAAKSAAALDAQAKADAAKSAATTAAAADAKSKADAAQAAALAAAKTYADAEAAGAGDAALAAAKADATAKADTAREAAKTAAAADAKAKADAAQAAAITTAAADAKAKADKALADAKTDATTKADAAKQAAITAAAADAQAKADAVRKVAEDARKAADEAQRNAPNMIVNGSFEQGLDGWKVENSTRSRLDTEQAYDGAVSWRTEGAGSYRQPVFRVEPGQVWRYEWYYKTTPEWTSGLPGGLRLQKWDGVAPAPNDAASSSLSRNEEWTHQAVEYTVPPTGVTHLAARFAFSFTTDGVKFANVDALRLTDVTALKALESRADAAQADATKAIADAAQALVDAKADATAKADAAQAAAEAKAKTAQDAADAALTMAGTKSRVYYSTGNATGTAKPGDVWRKVDSSKNVVAEWYWDTAWRSSKVTTDMVANLDVGKLTAGTGVIADLVAQKIAASTASFQTVDVAKLFATTATLSEAVITKLFAEVVRARMVSADAFIGENAILTGAITAPKITASEELTAKVAEFLTVRAEQIEANAIDGMVITGAVIQSPGSGAGYQLTADGYTSRDEDGNVTVRLPADGSPAQFRGDVEARSLTATGRVSMQAANNEVTSGASLVLESGVQPPATPPTVGAAYESSELGYPEDAYQIAGLAYANGLFWRFVELDTTSGNRGRIEGLTPAGAVSVSFPTGDMLARNGLVAIGSELFALGPHTGSSERRWVRVYSLAGAQLREWEYTEFGTGYYQPGIGTDGTNLVIAQCYRSDGEMSWRHYGKTGTFISQVRTGYRVSRDVVGVYQGSADFGASRVAVTRADGVTNVFTTAGAPVSAGGWRSARDAAAVGSVYASGKFWQLTPQGNLVSYSSFQDSAGDTSDWWVAQTWVGPSGAETPIGPGQRFTFMRRSGLQLSGGEMPPGVTGARYYLARMGTTPTRTDYHLIATSVGSKARLSALPSNWATLSAPPSGNTFANTSPGTVASRIGGFEVRGDGSGTWGPLVFHADGTMSSSAVPAWVPVTTFKSGFSPQSFGYTPAYRVWPDGKVEWRGTIGGTMAATMPILTVPAEARPAQAVNIVAATTGSVNTIRVEFKSNANPNDLTVYPVGTTRSWISLEGIYYYLD